MYLSLRKIFVPMSKIISVTGLVLIAELYSFYSCGQNISNQKLTFIPDTCYTYTNPVGGITNIGDPYVLHYEGKYYMYATSSPVGFKVWESSNLVDWDEKGFALTKFNNGDQWGQGNFWAPEVKFYNGKFYMVYSAIGDNGKMKVRIARSDNPLGPFIDWGEPFFNEDSYSYIDGDIFLDQNKSYLFFVRDCSTNLINGNHVSQICVVELNNDLSKIVETPETILSPDQTWENINQNWMWNEGPFVMKHDTTYYLLYSANYYASPDYSIGVATANSPMGPWTKYTGNPILKKNLSVGVSGPGHCMVTMSPDSTEYFIVYHTHTDFNHPSGNRNMCIDRLVFQNEIPHIIGPTRSPQPLPSGVKYRITYSEKK